MALPSVEAKVGDDAVYRAEDFIEALRDAGWNPGVVPRAVVFTYGGFDTVCSSQPDAYTMNPSLGPGPGRFFTVDATDGAVGICCMGIGAPAVVAILEVLIVLGVQRFVSLGTAGGLQPRQTPGDAVLISATVRDEGTSYHYLPADASADPDPDLTARLADAMHAGGIRFESGASWTIDAPYRQTKGEIARYRQDGLLTVEMEASALFAVGALRRVPIASVVVIDGAYGDPIAAPQVDRRTAYERLFQVLPVVIDVLRNEPGRPGSR